MNSICVSGRGTQSLATTDDRYEVSVQQLMSCNDKQRGCNGGSASHADNVWTSSGITKERDSPYKCKSGNPLNHFETIKPGSCDSFPWGGVCEKRGKQNQAWVYKSAHRLWKSKQKKQALVAGRGVYASLVVYQNFLRYKGG